MKKFLKYIFMLIIIIIVMIIFIVRYNNILKLNENLILSKNSKYIMNIITLTSNIEYKNPQNIQDEEEITEQTEIEENKEEVNNKKNESNEKKTVIKKEQTQNKTETKQDNNKKNTTEEKKESISKEEITESKVTTETEEKTESTVGKYNVTIKTTTRYTYEVENGNKKLIKQEVINTKYDSSTFSASTNELKPEAQGLVNNNRSQYNEMLGYVNNLRNENGKNPLTLDGNLNLAATIRALEMAWPSKFDHTRPDGRSCFTVFGDLGISYSMVGENIAGGTTNPKSTFNLWDNSPGHHNNMISSNYTKIGVGKATVNGVTFWVQLFSN
jgi:uncharacterized protein YkwD